MNKNVSYEDAKTAVSILLPDASDYERDKQALRLFEQLSAGQRPLFGGNGAASQPGPQPVTVEQVAADDDGQIALGEFAVDRRKEKQRDNLAGHLNKSVREVIGIYLATSSGMSATISEMAYFLGVTAPTVIEAINSLAADYDLRRYKGRSKIRLAAKNKNVQLRMQKDFIGEE